MSDEIEKKDKPQKLFEMSFEIWDDGQITRDLIELVRGDRGAPKKWRLEPRDFINSVKAQVVGGKMDLLVAIMASMDVNMDELLKTFNAKRDPKLPPPYLDANGDLEEDEDIDEDEMDFEEN